MKKILITLALMLTVSMASAIDIGVSTVYDYRLSSAGARVTLAAPQVGNFTPQVSVTHISNGYTRYAIGADYALAKFGTVSVAATGSGVYQDTFDASSGYGLVVGLKASVPVYKNVSFDASVERFAGQSRVNNTNGNVYSLGLSAKF